MSIVLLEVCLHYYLFICFMHTVCNVRARTSQYAYVQVSNSQYSTCAQYYFPQYVCMHVCIACMNSYTTYCTSSIVFNNNTSRTLVYYIMHNNNIRVLHIILLLSIARTRVCIQYSRVLGVLSQYAYYFYQLRAQYQLVCIIYIYIYYTPCCIYQLVNELVISSL